MIFKSIFSTKKFTTGEIICVLGYYTLKRSDFFSEFCQELMLTQSRETQRARQIAYAPISSLLDVSFILLGFFTQYPEICSWDVLAGIGLPGPPPEAFQGSALRCPDWGPQQPHPSSGGHPWGPWLLWILLFPGLSLPVSSQPFSRPGAPGIPCWGAA